MTDTQEAMREFEQFIKEHPKYTLVELWQAATAQSAEKIARLEAEREKLQQELISALRAEIVELQNELRGPIVDEPLRALGGKLAVILDSEQFNAVEPLLKSCAVERANALREAVCKLEYLKEKSEKYNRHRVPELRDDSIQGIDECIHELRSMEANNVRSYAYL